VAALSKPRFRCPRRRRYGAGVRIDEVGFTAKRATMGWPVEMPPRMPPALLVRNSGAPSRPMAHLVGILLARQGSGGQSPLDLDALHALMLISPLAMSWSSLP